MLSDTLKMLRKQKGLTRTQASKEIGIIERNLKSYELNESKPPIDILIKLADFYGVSTDYLLGRDERKFVEDVSKMSDNDLDKKLMQFFIDLPESSKQGIRDFMMSVVNGLDTKPQEQQIVQTKTQAPKPQSVQYVARDLTGKNVRGTINISKEDIKKAEIDDYSEYD